MITLHHLENSRSQRVLWLLEELGIPYAVVRYERDKSTMFAPPELRAVHPLGKSPIIVDDAAGAGASETIAETGAIIEYLVEKAEGRLGAPDDRAAALQYRYFLHYAEGSLMPPLLIKLVLGKIPIMGKIAQSRIQPMIDVHLDFVEAELGSRSWFAGDEFTAADVIMSFPLEAARDRGGLDETRPATLDWLARIHARSAYQSALITGGPYAYVKEFTRLPHHGSRVMPIFRLVSTAANNALALEFDDTDCSGALDLAQRARLSEAELWQAGKYLFTLRKHSDEVDFWIIYRKPELREPTRLLPQSGLLR